MAADGQDPQHPCGAPEASRITHYPSEASLRCSTRSFPTERVQGPLTDEPKGEEVKEGTDILIHPAASAAREREVASGGDSRIVSIDSIAILDALPKRVILGLDTRIALNRHHIGGGPEASPYPRVEPEEAARGYGGATLK